MRLVGVLGGFGPRGDRMAQQHIRYTFSVEDSEGVKAPATLYGTYDDTKTVAQLMTDLAAMKTLVVAVTDGQVVGSEASFVGSGAAAPTNFADSDVSQVASFNVPNSAGRTWNICIPAFKDAGITAGHINLADSDVSAFLVAVQPPGGDYTPTDRNWLATGALKDAFLATRKHRRALKRASFEVPTS